MSLFFLFEGRSKESAEGNKGDVTFENVYTKSGDNNGNCHRISQNKNIGDKAISCAAKIAWSSVLVIMASFFLAAAYVQHNDPDPFLWMPAYLVPCIVNVVLIFFALRPSSSKFWTIINWITNIHICFCYALGFWTLTHYIHGQMLGDEEKKILAEMVSEPNMQVEEAKELIGLCLIIAWLSFVNNGNFLKFGWKGIMFATLLTALPIVSWILVEKLEENRDQACF